MTPETQAALWVEAQEIAGRADPEEIFDLLALIEERHHKSEKRVKTEAEE